MGLLSRLLGTDGARRDLVSDLVDVYRAEAEQAAHLRQHAEQARYPHVAITLRELAAMEDRHAGWLRDHILGLGGGVPPVAPDPLIGRSQWERAVAARARAQQKRRRLVECVTRWDPDEPAIVATLHRIEAEDTAAMGEYELLVMRSDPHALD